MIFTNDHNLTKRIAPWLVRRLVVLEDIVVLVPRHKGVVLSKQTGITPPCFNRQFKLGGVTNGGVNIFFKFVGRNRHHLAPPQTIAQSSLTTRNSCTRPELVQIFVDIHAKLHLVDILAVVQRLIGVAVAAQLLAHAAGILIKRNCIPNEHALQAGAARTFVVLCEWVPGEIRNCSGVCPDAARASIGIAPARWNQPHDSTPVSNRRERSEAILRHFRQKLNMRLDKCAVAGP